MIKDESFSKEWILSLKSKPDYLMADPGLIEKMIYALHSVEFLRNSGMNFVFKGGTCLTLMFQKLRRFSIDVDIIVEEEKNVVEKFLSKLGKNSKFSRYETDEKRDHAGRLPVVHYNLYYKSIFSNDEKVILLDVLYDKNPYKSIQEIPIENSFLSTNSHTIKVFVPSVNDITADKLTAFAPNTIGIPYNTGKELQIIKQLFDIGFLYDSVNDLKCLKETFEKISAAQCHYRNADISTDKILEDIINTAFILAMQNRNKGEYKSNFEELQRGIHSLNSFIPNMRFNIIQAIELSAKSALLAAKLKSKNYDPLPLINGVEYSPADFPISEGIYQPISKMIKNMRNFSQFYWHHTAALLH